MRVFSDAGDAQYGFARVLLPAVGILAILVFAAVFLFTRSRIIMEQEIRTLLRTSAAVAALQFSGDELESIRGPEDMERPLYRSIAARLQDIRRSVPNIRYAYILRRTDNASTLEFVADADSTLSFQEQDENGNGLMDPFEEPSYPGDLYDITEIPLLQHQAFVEPSAEEEVTIDQWGQLISGFAPIYDSAGQVAAVVGIDMRAGDFAQRGYRIFSPVLLLLILLGAMFFVFGFFWIQYRRRLETLNLLEEERTALIQLALHRLGTPLTIFKWSIESLAECSKGKSCPVGEVERHLQQTRAGIDHMDKIIRALLEAERVRGGRLEYRPAPVTVREIIDRAQNIAEPQLRAKHQHLGVECDEELVVDTDAGLISGVLAELLVNASTYSPEGTTVVVRAKTRRREINVSVEDSGAGIPHDEIRRVFQKFFRSRNAGRFNPDGNGLGLYIAKGMVERAGGVMWLESVEGKGTTVGFTLPRR